MNRGNEQISLSEQRLTLNKTEVARLFGRSAGAIDYWQKYKGLPRLSNGRYDAASVLLWFQAYTKNQRPKLFTENLTQQQLAALFGVSRQAIVNWSRADLPRRSDGLYDLRAVCRWLRSYYQESAKKDYEDRLAAIQKKLSRNVAQLQRFLAIDEAG
jgi:phage terminase Nu1 subunit (DNA packaging protein)